MEQTRDLMDIVHDIEDVLGDLRNTREFQASYSGMFDRIDKTDYQKIYDHDTAAIMERVLFDRLYEEVTAIDKLFDELFAFACKLRAAGIEAKQTVQKTPLYGTAADMVRGKATE